MITKLMKGNDFEGVLRYALGKPEAEIIGGSVSHNPYASTVSKSDRLSAEFQLTRALRPTVKNPVCHTAISFHPSEKVTDRDMVDLADEFLSRMGWNLKKTQAIYIRHHDTDHPHLHVIASRIQLDKELVLERNDYARAISICRELEQEYDWKRVNAPPAILKSATKNEREILKRKQQPSARMQLQLAIVTAAQKTNQVGEFVEHLETMGVGVLPNVSEKGKVQGITYRLGNVFIRGSKLGIGCSWAGIQKHLGLTYDEQRDAPRLRAAGEREIARAIAAVTTPTDPGSAAAAADRAAPPTQQRTNSHKGTGESTGSSATGDESGEGGQLPSLAGGFDPEFRVRPEEPQESLSTRGSTASLGQKRSARGRNTTEKQLNISDRTGSSDCDNNANDESRCPTSQPQPLGDEVTSSRVGQPTRTNKRAKSDRNTYTDGVTRSSFDNQQQLALDFGEGQSNVGDEQQPSSQPLWEQGNRGEHNETNSVGPKVEWDAISGAAVGSAGGSSSNGSTTAAADDARGQDHNAQHSGASSREFFRTEFEAITRETRSLESERRLRYKAADLKLDPQGERASDERIAGTSGETATPTQSTVFGGDGAITVQPGGYAARDEDDRSDNPSKPGTAIASVSESSSGTELHFTTFPNSTSAAFEFEQGGDRGDLKPSESRACSHSEETTQTPQSNSRSSETLTSTDNSTAVDFPLAAGSESSTSWVGSRDANDCHDADSTPTTNTRHEKAVDGDLPAGGSAAQAVSGTTFISPPTPPTVERALENQRAYYGLLYRQYLSQTQSHTDAAVGVRALRAGHQKDEVAQILTQSPTVQAMSERLAKIEYIERTLRRAHEGYQKLQLQGRKTTQKTDLER